MVYVLEDGSIDEGGVELSSYALGKPSDGWEVVLSRWESRWGWGRVFLPRWECPECEAAGSGVNRLVPSQGGLTGGLITPRGDAQLSGGVVEGRCGEGRCVPACVL